MEHVVYPPVHQAIRGSNEEELGRRRKKTSEWTLKKNMFPILVVCVDGPSFQEYPIYPAWNIDATVTAFSQASILKNMREDIISNFITLLILALNFCMTLHELQHAKKRTKYFFLEISRQGESGDSAKI